MVKRLIAILIGASAGALVCLIFGFLISNRSQASDGEACSPTDLVECVRFETPVRAVPPEAVRAEIAQPCKGWLTGHASAALLSQCLHQARDERKKDITRKLAIAASS